MRLFQHFLGEVCTPCPSPLEQFIPTLYPIRSSFSSLSFSIKFFHNFLVKTCRSFVYTIFLLIVLALLRRLSLQAGDAEYKFNFTSSESVCYLFDIKSWVNACFLKCLYNTAIYIWPDDHNICIIVLKFLSVVSRGVMIESPLDSTSSLVIAR